MQRYPSSILGHETGTVFGVSLHRPQYTTFSCRIPVYVTTSFWAINAT